MNIKITDSWLREHLETKASAQKIAELISLCGPNVEKLEKIGKDWIYEIEVTTNRVDLMSVRGVAREAAAILPEFGIKAKLKPLRLIKPANKNELGIKIMNNPKLCSRILAIKLENVKMGESPEWLAERLEKVGQRSLNRVIDITNYVMWELGHPIHVFDYDRIKGKKIVVREARKSERLVTLDGKEYKLRGGEVVFDNGRGEIIDLPGIMGTANTVVTPNTKNLLLWTESVNEVKIRQASMGLGIRTQAAIINEKRADPELGKEAILRAVNLYENLTKAKVVSKLVDIGEGRRKTKEIKVSWELIRSRLGITLSKSKIKNILERLGFGAYWKGNEIVIKVPSYRDDDISIGEDIVEEVARIYGYFRLPSELMRGSLPKESGTIIFDFEIGVKRLLKSRGGIEVYTQSLVNEMMAGKGALRLKNPLGEDSKYLRMSLISSLRKAVEDNLGENKKYWLFEMANVYLPRKNKLPEERMMVAGICDGYQYREAKGVIESLLDELRIVYLIKQTEAAGFETNQALEIWSGKEKIGILGKIAETKYYYWEFEVNKLSAKYQPIKKYQPMAKYPAQIEDVTFRFPERTKIGEVMAMIQTIKLVERVELTEIYKGNYSFRVWYQSPNKTLNDQEVKRIRKRVLERVKKKFGGVVRS